MSDTNFEPRIRVTGDLLLRRSESKNMRSSIDDLLGELDLGSVEPMFGKGTRSEGKTQLTRWRIARGNPMADRVRYPEVLQADINRIKADGEFDVVEPDFLYEEPFTEEMREVEHKSIALRAQESWHLDHVGAFRAWEHIRAQGEKPGEHVAVGHLDTGITRHPVLETMGSRLLEEKGMGLRKPAKIRGRPSPTGMVRSARPWHRHARDFGGQSSRT